MRMRRTGSAAAGALVVLLACASAAAQAKAPAAKSGPKVNVPAEVVAKLKSSDPAQVKAGLDDVRTLGKQGAPAASEIGALLDRGVTNAIAEAALDTLADLEVESTSTSIVPYATHRNTKVRQAAVKALVHTKGAAAVKALRHALSDSDPMVRGIAATGLGTLKAKEAVPDLFMALEHRVGEAAASIGQVCTPDDCDKLTARLGRQPFDVVSGGLDQILFRPTSEVPDDTKVKVIGKVRELGTQEANKFLRDIQKRWPANGSARVKQAIEQGVQATGGGGPS